MFGDPLSMTFHDPDHSIEEDRYITVGLHGWESYWLSHTQIEGSGYALLVHEKPRVVRGNSMRKEIDTVGDDELRAEYDFSQLQGGIRGKYVERYDEGTNLVLLAPDVAEIFRSDEAVNEALRLLMKIAKAQVGHEVQA